MVGEFLMVGKRPVAGAGMGSGRGRATKYELVVSLQVSCAKKPELAKFDSGTTENRWGRFDFLVQSTAP